MRLTRYYVLEVTILIGMAISVSAQATHDRVLQVPSTTSVTGTVTVRIPFAFLLNSQSFPAGEYSIAAANERAIAIRNTDGSKAIVALTNPVMTANDVSAPKMIFHRYRGQYFLSEVWLRQSDTGRSFATSVEEVRAARNFKLEQITLARTN